jgi:hypothetical protein
MRALLLVAVMFGCSGDEPPPTGKCSGALYQPCAEEHDCNSGLCQNFAADGFQVCSQLCDAANPCPDGAACDPLGVCKPAAPDDCTLD